MKTLLCCIVKNENRYIDEWITYHKSIGFDDIIIYDNNDKDGETLDVEKYDFVKVIDFRGKYIEVLDPTKCVYNPFMGGVQEWAFTDCYLNHSDEYDWVAFLDADEYLVIDNGLTLGEFLAKDGFIDVDAIQINWKIYGDNGNILYDSKPLQERFTTPSKNQLPYVKSIVKTNNPNFIRMRGHNAIIYQGKYVYPNGNETKCSISQRVNYEGARIKHYFTKTIDEWIDRRYKKVSVDGVSWINQGDTCIKQFFMFNDWSEDKQKVIEKKMGSI